MFRNLSLDYVAIILDLVGIGLCFYHTLLMPLFTCIVSQGKKIKCSASQARNRLFIGNVPRNWVEDDMKKAVTQIGPGVIKAELMKVVPPSFLF